jgi:hypothetical protein
MPVYHSIIVIVPLYILDLILNRVNCIHAYRMVNKRGLHRYKWFTFEQGVGL